MKRINPNDYNHAADAWDRGEADTETNAAECPKCYGSGTLGWNGVFGPGMKLIPCDCAAAVTGNTRRSGLEDVKHQTFERFVALPSVIHHVQRCMDYSQNPVGWLLLTGPVGTGKSHLSAAIANARAARGESVLFSTVGDLLGDLQATFDRGADETFTARLRRFREVDVLVLDDFGTENATPWSNEKIFQIVNHRYTASLPTVITTNEPLSKFHPRLASRMSDVVLVDRLDFTGAVDFRSLPMHQRRAA